MNDTTNEPLTVAPTETSSEKTMEKVLVTFTTTPEFDERIREAMKTEGFTRRSAFVYAAVKEYIEKAKQ
jgi:metal-responsive CopG/Arc/MetJ family transcriptional regulator